MIYTSKDAIKVRVYETYLAKEKMNSDLFDFQVRLPKYLLLETYAEIMHAIEPDSMVVQLSNVKIIKNDFEILIAGDRIEPGFLAVGDEVFEGNYKDFMFSLVGKEAETGIYRIISPFFEKKRVRGFQYPIIE